MTLGWLFGASDLHSSPRNAGNEHESERRGATDGEDHDQTQRDPPTATDGALPDRLPVCQVLSVEVYTLIEWRLRLGTFLNAPAEVVGDVPGSALTPFALTSSNHEVPPNQDG